MKAVAVLQEAQVVVDADPGLRGFGQQGALGQRGGVDRDQVEALLVARLALVDQGLAVALQSARTR
jgi:hypothetical protein